MEQLQRSLRLLAGLESCELHQYRPSGGDADGTQNTKADSGVKTWACVPGHLEGV